MGTIRNGYLIAIAVGALGCSAQAPADAVVDQLIELRVLGWGPLPPIFTGCGRMQSGYVAGDPNAEPPLPATLDGVPYDATQDPFCSLAVTSEFSMEGGRVIRDDHIYLLHMGEPDPGAAIPEHLRFLREQLERGGAAHYCHFRWSVEARPHQDVPESDVQELTYTLTEHPSYYCSKEYNARLPYEPGYQESEVAMRSTDPRVVLFWGSYELGVMGGDARFRGIAGVPESGGTSDASPREGEGAALYYRACTPEAATSGPGTCPATCRAYSATQDLRACNWDDVRSAPANTALIHPEWSEDYPHLYNELFEP
ncbi:MAG: hypothetical protein KF729_22770 [Sandaracinaceae bacterium]|nr:hypothetical protein [Sandaracinaceae bacterium]